MATELEEQHIMASRPDHHRPISPLSQSQQSKPRGGMRFLSFVLQTVVMAVALSVFFLFAGVAAVIITHLLVAGRSLRRRRFQHRSLRNPNPNPCGLSPDELETLPFFVFSDEIKTLALTAMEDCPICLDVFREGERCRSLPSCGHCFHVVCIDRWLVKTPACPICRGGIDRPEMIAAV